MRCDRSWTTGSIDLARGLEHGHSKHMIKNIAVYERLSDTVALVRLPGCTDQVEYVSSSRTAFDSEVRAWCASHGAAEVLEVWT